MAFQAITGIFTRQDKSIKLPIPKTTVTANAGATTITTGIKIPVGMTALFKMRMFGSAGAARGAYEVTGAVANKAGTTALIGTKSALAFEDTSAWDATVVANDTKDSIDIQVTPDTTTNTTFQGFIEIWFM